MTEEYKLKLLKNYLIEIELNKNIYFNINVRIQDFKEIKGRKNPSMIIVRYELQTISKLDGNWSLSKNKTLEIKGTFETVFIKELRDRKLKELGI
jgi:hypothetical protein